MHKTSWKLAIGQGVIDSSYSNTKKVVAAGDVNGLCIVSDYQGNIIQKYQYELPVWGIDISDDGNVLAIALASKQPSKGAFIIIKNGIELFRYDTQNPVWDVKIIDDYVIATTWGEGLLYFSMSSKVVENIDIDGSLFGIYANTSEEVYIVASSKGIHLVNIPSKSHKYISKNPFGCYNITYSSSLNAFFYGSNENLLCSLQIKNTEEKLYKTLFNSVCGVSEYKKLLIYGDLHGNLFISHSSLPTTPIYYKVFPGSIWNIAVDQEEGVAFIACGDGSLYCLDISDELKKSSRWDIEKFPFDLSAIQGTRVFISYASEDKTTAEILYNNLRELGCSPWLDRHNLLPGQSWRQEIKKAIEDSEFFIVCLSVNSVTKKGFVQKEMRKGLEMIEELPDGQIFLLPVRIDDCEIPDSFSEWQWVDLSSDDGFYKIILAIYTEKMRKLKAKASNN